MLNKLKIPPLFERYYVVLVLLLTTGAISQAGNTDDPSAGSLLTQSIWAIIYVASFGGLFLRKERFLALLSRSQPILALIALAAISCCWSLDPLLTLRRAFGLWGTTAFAYYIVVRFTLAEFIDILAIATTIGALLSVATVVAFPSMGIMQESYPGAWQGIFPQKNLLGQFMAFGIMTFISLAGIFSRRKRWYALVAVAVFMLILMKSQSATSLLVALFSIAFMLLVLSYRHSPQLGSILLAGYTLLGGASLFLIGGSNNIADILGRNTTLTGRTELWPVVIQAIQDHPLLGYGYAVFWTVSSFPDYIFQTQGWRPFHAHNGFLELALDLGAVGILLFAVTFFWSFRSAIAHFHKNFRGFGAWPLMVLLDFIAVNLTESSIAKYNEFNWVMFTIAALYTVRETGKKVHRLYRLDQTNPFS